MIINWRLFLLNLYQFLTYWVMSCAYRKNMVAFINKLKKCWQADAYNIKMSTFLTKVIQ